ncbi:ABC transporter permease [Novilysobacter defluvii]|uniref:Multidrug ABC transporter substrate-binding protein n=1 Tax=Lysobacter defluvii IMMIB APB-9 = DSM 18482 TaxID=1385515 RepID=A0A0A0M4M9_9GAMM|nr:ABC transporter permease [Lysobacter defluvii]KGO98050.1 multidrug ABC transporter substrate-binding protein [Lysobacter defluvii IMMIB APB-9 = DSM 18482]
MNFLEVLRTATFALRGNWLRSALTSLGVIIGIAAVIVMVSVGQGTQSEIDKLVSGLGSNRLDIMPNTRRAAGGVRMSASSFYTLDVRDAEAIREEIPEVQYVGGVLRGNTQVVFAENNWSASWQGIQPDWFELESWGLSMGEGFGPRDYGGSTKPVILGETVRRELFGDLDPVGQSIRLGRVPFTVVGVLEPKGQGGWGQDQDDVVLVPLETARRRLMGAMGLPPGAVQQIAVGVTRAEDLGYVQEQIEALLRQRHDIQPGAEDDFRVRNIAEIVATRTQTTRLMSLLLAAVATISLVVGGIGIMNIMLVSVTERIREIGLRMAVGAGPSDIRRQFLAEAMLISLVGGAVGIAIGVVGALLVGRFGSLPVVVDLQVVGLAAGFSIATGLFFGYYPARKASLLDPIEALRQQ